MAKKKTEKVEQSNTEVKPEVKAPTPEDTNRLHNRKTKEELQAEIDDTMKQLEEEPDNEEPEKDNEEDNTQPGGEIKFKEPDKEEQENKESKEKEPEKKPVDFKKRYEDSSREAHILYEKDKKWQEAVSKASEIPEPTDEEMEKEYPDWEVMSDFERKMARKDMHNTLKLDAISNVAKEFKDMDAWDTKVDEFLADPETLVKHPEIDGKEDEFKIFVAKDSRRGVDFETLVSAFLYTADKGVIKHKGSMFPTGSAGENKKTEPKSDKISVEESIKLRENDYPKYMELLKAGKIETQVA